MWDYLLIILDFVVILGSLLFIQYDLAKRGIGLKDKHLWFGFVAILAGWFFLRLVGVAMVLAVYYLFGQKFLPEVKTEPNQ